ncbi:hypothetical protein GCM10023175_36140 [Pseudonocardia xishanensis]|uniref:Uncharacterized protein n=1 Tax=Pseudonocardia xishanensis TaxID=630995 RepID=A0ABP8RVP3_9PSEU
MVLAAARRTGTAVAAWVGEQAVEAATPAARRDRRRSMVAELVRVRIELSAIASAGGVSADAVAARLQQLDEVLDRIVASTPGRR